MPEAADRRWDGPPLEAWDPWSPATLAEKLRGASASWCVVGGWSIDLFLGQQTRDHEDLEIATTRADFASVRRALEGCALHSVGDGEVRRLGADEPPAPERHQHWVLDEEASAWRADVMVEPGDQHRWVFRRDERVEASRHEMVGFTADLIPYLKPHGALLYKAKAQRPKDEADFAAALPRMTEDDREWLAAALEVVHPGHPWISRARWE